MTFGYLRSNAALMSWMAFFGPSPVSEPTTRRVTGPSDSNPVA